MICDLSAFGFDGHLIDTDKIYYVGPVARELADSPRHGRLRYQDFLMISLGGARFPIMCPAVPFAAEEMPGFDQVPPDKGLVELHAFFCEELKARGSGASEDVSELGRAIAGR